MLARFLVRPDSQSEPFRVDLWRVGIFHRIFPLFQHSHKSLELSRRHTSTPASFLRADSPSDNHSEIRNDKHRQTSIRWIGQPLH